MFSNNMTIIWFLIIAITRLRSGNSTIAAAQQAKRLFTVADEIGLVHFGDPYMGGAEALRLSPDGNYVAVDTERGVLDLNRIEDSLRFYRSEDIESFLKHSDESQPPSPVWIFNLPSDKEGRIIREWRWLADSSGVAFLEHRAGDNQLLILADLRNKKMELLTSTAETVDAFDIRDRQHYVYTVTDPIPLEKSRDERRAPAILGTGLSLPQLILPDDPQTIRWYPSHRKHLWAVIDGKRFEVKDNGPPSTVLELSPDGNSLVTTLPVAQVPVSWETMYPPPFPSDAHRLRAGKTVQQFVRINLQTGYVQSLTEAPNSLSGGLWAPVFGGPSWSSDGQAILLPGTYIDSKNGTPSRPCVAVVNLLSNTRACVEMLKGFTETGVEKDFHSIVEAHFVGGDKQRVIVTFVDRIDSSHRAIEYRQSADGFWQIALHINSVTEVGHGGLTVAVKQGISEPPQLVATNEETSRVIWDPNPQLKNMELGEASVYRWKDKDGREWKGGLFKPVNYKAGQRYPLVIQTHGFTESEFQPAGLLPTAFAARALAAAGIAVLQIAEHCPMVTPSEGPCAVSGYEAAANQLVSDGLVDSEKIGIIGFSRSCFYVMETLTTSSLHIRAASITDGVMASYLQYMIWGELGNGVANEMNSLIGAQPFGEGLPQWLRRSPGFNLDKVSAPLQVVGAGSNSMLGMWEVYAGLRYLQKPVELVMLNTSEHVLTNPAVRMASQGGSVDWFRFWLQDYEDPDPAKKEQYERWRGLRKMQEENDAKDKAAKAKAVN
jgi:dipeptidyl aminopeptidase/acylaminoacyl peptidase